jgi:hypothetical protein
MAACHVRAGPSLVDEDQPVGVEIELALEPVPAAGEDVGPVLFGGVRGLFLRVIPCRSRNRHKVPIPTATPRPRSISSSSSSVMSGVSASAAWIRAACASIRAERRSPPCLRGAADPRCSKRCRQRIALDTLTPNRAAAARHDRPSSTAAKTRSRKSIDKARPIPADLLIGNQDESENNALGNPSRFNRFGNRSKGGRPGNRAVLLRRAAESLTVAARATGNLAKSAWMAIGEAGTIDMRLSGGGKVRLTFRRRAASSAITANSRGTRATPASSNMPRP